MADLAAKHERAMQEKETEHQQEMEGLRESAKQEQEKLLSTIEGLQKQMETFARCLPMMAQLEQKMAEGGDDVLGLPRKKQSTGSTPTKILEAKSSLEDKAKGNHD